VNEPSIRPKVLFVTPWPPSGRGSGGQFVSGLLLRLYSEFCDVDIIAGYGPGFERSAPFPGDERVVEWVPLRLQHREHPLYARGIAAWAWLNGRSLRAEKMGTRRMQRAVNQALSGNSYDVLHVDMALMRPYLQRTQLPVVVSSQNVEPEVFRRMAERAHGVTRCAALIEASRVRKMEGLALRAATRVIAMSERDRRILSALHGISRNRIVPLYPAITERASTGSYHSRSVLLLGSLAAPGRLEGTEWFLRSVWPLLRQAMPTTRVHIVGHAPPASLKRLAGTNGIQVHGFVTDLEPVLRDTSVLAVPLRVGAGIRVKIVELMARGIPVVATTVAATGLRSETWPVIQVVDDAAGFAAAIARNLSGADIWARESTRQRRHALDAYGIAMAREAMREILATTIGTSLQQLSGQRERDKTHAD